MLNQQASLYDIYSQTYGKVKSGTKIDNGDYVFRTGGGGISYNEQQRLAVTVAIEDQKNGTPMKTKSELETEITRLLK